MLDVARKAIGLAQKHGAEQAEAFVTKNSIITIRIASGKIFETKRVQGGGVGLRVAIGKKVGFSSANELTAELAKRCISVARARPQNPDFNGFPKPAKIKRVSGIYDRRLETLPSERITGLAETMLQSAFDFDKRVVDASGALNLFIEHRSIANTNGIGASDKTTRILGHLTVEAQDLERSEGQGWSGGTSLSTFKPSAIGEKAAELAVNSLHAKNVKSGSHDVILEPVAAAELFYNVLAYALNGREVYNRISYFADRLGKVVAPEDFGVCDWGNMSSGLCSKMIDDEGTPTRRTPLIDQGKLMGFVYDHYYGGRAGEQSTGNGIRLSDMPSRIHAVEPTPYMTNLVIQAGDFKSGELIEDTREGLLLSRIWYTYPITPQLGDFSTTSRCGFLVRGGELVGAIKQVRIHENLPRLLKQVTGVGKDVAQVMPWGASAAICTPSLRFHNVRIT